VAVRGIIGLLSLEYPFLQFVCFQIPNFLVRVYAAGTRLSRLDKSLNKNKKAFQFLSESSPIVCNNYYPILAG